MSAHSPIGASGMYRWSKCPGSVKLCKDLPNTPSTFAQEGIKAHEIAAAILETGIWPTDEDPEMLAAIKVYIDTIKQDHVGPTDLLVEHKFDLSVLHPGLFGTADCVIYYPNHKLLRVYDYKHGKGVPVEVENNPQLLYYGLGALISKKYRARTIELIVVQPRCDHKDGVVRRWQLPAINLIDFAADLKSFAVATEQPDAPLLSGSHCKFCPAANGVCPIVYEKKIKKAQEDFEPLFI